MRPVDALVDIIRPGLMYLPEKMRGLDAEAMLLAIGLQESGFTHRHQIGGPARGFFQFEKGGGVKGVLTHHSSALLAHETLRYFEIPSVETYDAIAYHDSLAVVFARLLLWTDADSLPTILSPAEDSWEYYLRNWRPGKPHERTWASNRDVACKTVKEYNGGTV